MNKLERIRTVAPEQELLFFCLCCRQINRGRQRRLSASTGSLSVRGRVRVGGRRGWHLVLEAKVAFGMLLINVTILHETQLKS
jgi:hypothetical protein